MRTIDLDLGGLEIEFYEPVQPIVVVTNHFPVKSSFSGYTPKLMKLER